MSTWPDDNWPSPARANAGRSTAITDIAAERRRQIDAEGWTPWHDDIHADGELAAAAACYIVGGFGTPSFRPNALPPLSWPWSWDWWRPTDRRRDLVKAGALIAAEIERLDRITAISDAQEPSA